MPEAEKKTIRETANDAIRLAKTLIATARFASLAANGEANGHPSVSRVQISTDIDGTPIVLASSLSPHFQAMVERPKISLLIGEPGKGDPLAHPRITIFTTAEKIEHDTDQHTRLRARHLARHPKAKLYVDFGDFAFFKLIPDHASLNGGFGKAFELTADDLRIKGDCDGIAKMEPSIIEHMNDDHGEAVQLYIRAFTKADRENWTLIAIDGEGMICASGDRLERIWFAEPVSKSEDVRAELVTMAKKARSILEGSTE